MRVVEVTGSFVLLCAALLVAWPAALSGQGENPRLRGAKDRSSFALPGQDISVFQHFFDGATESCTVKFPGQTGMVNAFLPGPQYPMVWIRDFATQIPLLRYEYPRDYLTGTVEEILAIQESNGSITDWVSPYCRFTDDGVCWKQGAPHARIVYKSATTTLWADKNTIAADQEASMVDAAFQILTITGDRAWLCKLVGGKRILDRLDLALEYLLKNRFDAAHGLVTSGFTVDWGDASPVYPDQRVIYLDQNTPVVAAVYPNAMFVLAARELGSVYTVLGMADRAKYWLNESELIKANVNKYLWQEDKGFYRMHLTLTPALARGYPDDSDMFAVGGNAVAVIAGVASDRQAAQIFEVAEKRRREFNITTVAGDVLPPFSVGFFKAPWGKPYSYLNGGQWDWFAARLVLAEFERGHSTLAYRQLTQLASKDARAGGLYEWNTPNGEGRGANPYLSNAGVLARAVFEGLFGVKLSDSTLELFVRMARHSARIELHQPANGATIAYDYSYSANEKVIRLHYAGSVTRPGSLAILVPAGERARKLLKDGHEVEFKTRTIGQDSFIEIDTDWAAHDLRLDLS